MGIKCGKIPKNQTVLSEEQIQTLISKTNFNRQQISELHTGFLVKRNILGDSYGEN
jgi:hypothetical protein